MDRMHQNILQALRENIVADMDVYNGILKPLRVEYILTDQQITEIEAGATKQERAKILLDILPSRGPYAFDIFRQALRHHYEWLSEDMDRLENCFSGLKYVGSPTIPPISPLSVTREEKMKQLRKHLEQLEPNGYVVLHGMKGFGKSCLTASTLKDSQYVKALFFNQVYWIKFGYKRAIDEEILIQLNRLYHLVKNMEILPEALKPEILKDSLIHFLKHHFSRDKHCNALLILDDVCNSKIIEAFDFECKTLVITPDLDVVWEKRPSVVEMNDGFTEAETLDLFAKVLDTEVDKLPLEAKLIHYECKGMPLLIAMFSAQFEEFKHDMRLHSDRWKYYLNALKNKDEKNYVIKKFLKKQEAIFNMCIEQLPADMRERYEELVIFREDVNITPQALEILWGGSPFQVEEMMLDFCHKSLAAKQWNDELKSYIYGVHDLLLCHLRKKFSKYDLINMHKSLIEKYRNYCNGDFSKLPPDNYSYSYIGYHLEQSQLFDEFPKIYLDFNFIQATIAHSGLSNLLIDINNYREYITKNYDPVYVMRVTDLEKFLEEKASIIAEHRRKKCLDILQIAMSHSHQGYVRQTATKLASQRFKHLYVLHDRKLGEMELPYSEEMSTEIHTSCFAFDPDLVLIGNGVGEVLLWDSKYKREKVFSGHDKNSRIKKIVVSPQEDCFLSLDDQGIVKLFKLSDAENYEETVVAVLSPRQKQSFWSGIFTSQIPHDDSSLVFSVTGEIILDITFGYGNIAACTDKGTIRIWDRRGNIISEHSHNLHSRHLKNIEFTMGNNLLHILDETNGVLISYLRYGGEYQYLSQYNLNLQKKKIVFFGRVPEQNNSLFIVTERTAIYLKWFSKDHMHSLEKQTRASIEDERTVYTCACLTKDGQYIVLADSSRFINIWNVDVGHQPIATYKLRASSLDTYWMKEEGYHIICGSENQLLHKWKLPLGETFTSIRKPQFDAIIEKSGDKPDTVAIETLSSTIAVLVGDKVVAETEPVDGKISNLILSRNTNKIIYSTDKGVVHIFDITNKENIRALNFQCNVELIEFFEVFTDVLQIFIPEMIVCKGKDENLRVWKNTRIGYLVESVGHVISLHKVARDCVVTVDRNGIITLWNIDNTNWLRVDRVTVANSDIISTSSCLSYNANYLTVLNANGLMVLYKLQNDTITLPPCYKITEYFRKHYPQKLTCCKMSENEKYLALGSENGEIYIIDILIQEEICKLPFHRSSVTQLYWAPLIIQAPILLSVSCDELVWWNITYAIYVSKPKRRLRAAINRSISTPTVTKKVNGNAHISASQSVGSQICNMQIGLEGNGVATGDTNSLSNFWNSKEGKDPMQPALLGVVELPSDCFAKVCISPDFTKFVTVDINGSISTFTLCGYN